MDPLKEILGAVGARGVILDPEGKEEFIYEWGLG
jgi:hypothetical protein